MTVADAVAAIADLRHRRRELRRELARVRWWRRLVSARKDLAVARLADVDELDRLGVSDEWEALAAGAPTATELADAVWPEGGKPSPSSVEALAALDARLESYETRVSEILDSVTQDMVRALGKAHREEQ